MPPLVAALMRLGNADRQKLALAAGGFIAALVLAIVGLLRLVDAIAFGLLELMHPAWASLVTALIVFLLALGAFGLAGLWLKVALATARRTSFGGLSPRTVGTLLGGFQKVVKTHRKEAIFAAALAGIVLAAAEPGGQGRDRRGDDRR